MTEVVNATVPVSATEKPFVPQSPIVFYGGSPAKGLNGRERAALLKVINKTRSGEKTYAIEVTYKRISDGAPRQEGVDFQAPSGVAHNVHQGTVLNARMTQEGNYILLIDDTLRRNLGQTGFTSLRLDGLRSLKVQAETDGPLPKPKGTPRVSSLDKDLIDII